MDTRIVFLCFVIVHGKCLVDGLPEYGKYSSYNSHEAIGEESNIFGESSELALFSGETEGKEEKGSLFDEESSFDRPKFSFQSEDASDEREFQGSDHHVTKYKKTELDSPSDLKTATESSSGNKPGNHSSDQVKKATDGDKSSRYSSYKSPEQNFPSKNGKQTHWTGKESGYSASKSNSQKLYPGFPNKPDDVEMILPHHKTLYLPMVNGKPKPYDGYRAAPEVRPHQSSGSKVGKENLKDRDRRLSQGDIIYGKPRVARGPYHLQLKRSPAEYHGGIHPYYDFTDSTLYWNNADASVPMKSKQYSEASTQEEKLEFPENFFGGNNRDFLSSFGYEVKEDNGEGDGEVNEDVGSTEGFDFDSEYNSEPEEGIEESKSLPVFLFNDDFDAGFQTDGESTKGFPFEKNNDVEGNLAKYFSLNNFENPVPKVPEFAKNLRKIMENSRKKDKETQREESKTKEEAKADEKPEEDYKCGDQSKAGGRCAKESEESLPTERGNIQPDKGVHREKRSAKHAQRSDDVGRSSYKEGYSRDTESSDVEYITNPNPRSFRSDSSRQRQVSTGTRRYAKSATNYGGSNTYRQKPQTFSFNWDSPSSIKNKKSYGGQAESSKVYGGSFSYDNSGENYGVPASIYEGINFESLEEDEPYDSVRDVEQSKNQNYYHRSLSSNAYSDRYKERQGQNRYESSRSYGHGSHTPRQHSRTNFNDGGFRSKKYANGNGVSEVSKPFQQRRDDRENRGPQTYQQSQSEQRTLTTVSQVGRTKVHQNANTEVNDSKGSCQTERRGKMLCRICTNEKTSATYEQCRFASHEKHVEYKDRKSFKNPFREFGNSDLKAEKSDIVEEKASSSDPSTAGQIPKAASIAVAPVEKAQSEKVRSLLRRLERREVLQDEHKSLFEGFSIGMDDGEKHEASVDDEFEDAFLGLGEGGDDLTLHEHDEKGDFESEGFFGFDSFDAQDFGNLEQEEQEGKEHEGEVGGGEQEEHELSF